MLLCVSCGTPSGGAHHLASTIRYWNSDFLLVMGWQPELTAIEGGYSSVKSILHGFTLIPYRCAGASPMAQRVKNLHAMPETQETPVQSLGGEDPLEEEMATHSSILAWKILWTEEPGGLQSKVSQRVGHDWSGWASTHVWLKRDLFSHSSGSWKSRIRIPA